MGSYLYNSIHMKLWKKKIYGENIGIVFAWGEGIVLYWGFTKKIYDKTFWSDGNVLYFGRDLGYLSVYNYTYWLIHLRFVQFSVCKFTLRKKNQHRETVVNKYWILVHDIHAEVCADVYSLLWDALKKKKKRKKHRWVDG